MARPAPIGLIDGERLLDLLFEHQIGVRERPAALYEFDEAFSQRGLNRTRQTPMIEAAEISLEGLFMSLFGDIRNGRRVG